LEVCLYLLSIVRYTDLCVGRRHDGYERSSLFSCPPSPNNEGE
jgi:hypothetical protein